MLVGPYVTLYCAWWLNPGTFTSTPGQGSCTACAALEYTSGTAACQSISAASSCVPYNATVCNSVLPIAALVSVDVATQVLREQAISSDIAASGSAACAALTARVLCSVAIPECNTLDSTNVTYPVCKSLCTEVFNKCPTLATLLPAGLCSGLPPQEPFIQVGPGASYNVSCREYQLRERVELRMTGTVAGFNRAAFLTALAALLGINVDQISIFAVRSGSVIATVDFVQKANAPAGSVAPSVILSNLKSKAQSGAPGLTNLGVLSVTPNNEVPVIVPQPAPSSSSGKLAFCVGCSRFVVWAVLSTNSCHRNAGLSGGGIAGIVIGVLVGVALIGAAVWYWKVKRPSKELASLNLDSSFHTSQGSGTAGALTSGASASDVKPAVPAYTH